MTCGRFRVHLGDGLMTCGRFCSFRATRRECTFAGYVSSDGGKKNQNAPKLSIGKSVSVLGVCTIPAWRVAGRQHSQPWEGTRQGV